MITLQNISSSTRDLIIRRETKFSIKQVAASRFVRLTFTEYNLITHNNANPLSGTDGEDNSSLIWKWVSPLDEFGFPVVPPPTEETPPVEPPVQVPPPPITSIEDRIVDGGTKAPTQNAVHDALQEKAEWGGGDARPSNPKLGQMWYDQNLKRPIWWDGDSWVDYLGGGDLSGTMTVAGQGQLTIPCQGQPLNYEVHFNDNPVWTGCGPQVDDQIGIEVITSPSYSLLIRWDIATNTRAIEWSAEFAKDV